MPQKRNPVPLEHLRLKLSLAGGSAEQIVQTMHNTPFADMNDSERETQATGFAVFDRLDHTLPLLGGFIESMQTNQTSIEERIQKSMATITELADTLVRAEAISFRAAHHIASRLAAEALQQKIRLSDLAFDLFAAIFEKQVGRPARITADDLKKAVSPAHFVAVRDMPGGPAPAALAKSLAGYRSWLARLQDETGRTDQRIRQADKDRQAAVASLIKKGS